MKKHLATENHPLVKQDVYTFFLIYYNKHIVKVVFIVKELENSTQTLI